MSAKKRKSGLKKWIIAGVVSAVVIALAVAIILRPAPDIYQSVQAKTGDITTYYSFAGNVETQNRQTILADRALQVSELEVAKGDAVEEGDVLVRTTAGQRIKARINGEVASIDAEEDEQVMAGTRLLEIVDYDNLQIEVKVDEYDIAAIAEGKEATIQISATDQELAGTISSVSKEGTIENGVTFFTATIELPKESGLKIGLSAEVRVVGDRVSGVVTLPMTAIEFDDNNNPYVLKKGPDGNPVQTAITTGINDGVTAEVREGLASGDTVLYEKEPIMERMRFGNTAGADTSDGGND